MAGPKVSFIRRFHCSKFFCHNSFLFQFYFRNENVIVEGRLMGVVNYSYTEDYAYGQQANYSQLQSGYAGFNYTALHHGSSGYAGDHASTGYTNVIYNANYSTPDYINYSIEGYTEVDADLGYTNPDTIDINMTDTNSGPGYTATDTTAEANADANADPITNADGTNANPGYINADTDANPSYSNTDTIADANADADSTDANVDPGSTNADTNTNPGYTNYTDTTIDHNTTDNPYEDTVNTTENK